MAKEQLKRIYVLIISTIILDSTLMSWTLALGYSLYLTKVITVLKTLKDG